LHPVNFRSKSLFQHDILPAAQRKLIDYLPNTLARESLDTTALLLVAWQVSNGTRDAPPR
jgi:hypothetical protein